MKTDRESLIGMAKSGSWPHAAAPQQVVPDDNAAKRDRAADILSQMIRLTPEDTLLDIGCGEGHVAALAAEGCKIAVGYDPVWQGWDRHAHATLYTDWRTVLANGPYSKVLLYDVLDHATHKSQVAILEKARDVLAPGGTILVRCHPFVSPHGTHLYSSLNLAYVHLLLDDADVRALGGKPQRVVRVVRPLDTYRSWFQQAGLSVTAEAATRCVIPEMFHDPDVLAAVAANTYKAGLAGGAKVGNKGVLHGFMSIEFVDYTLAVS